MAKPSSSPQPKAERRAFKLQEVRATAGEEGKAARLAGHAAVFDTPYDLGWFTERVERGAFADSIKVDDIRALFNHDPNFVLGRNTAGTLTLSEDEKGLAIEIALPDTQTARDLLISINRGDISQMSIGFNVLEETWELSQADDKPDLRTLKKVKLWDVSPVTFPASPTTDIAQRSHEAAVEEAKPKVTPLSVMQQRQKLLELETA